MEIKFRGISLDTGKWVYGYAVFFCFIECANIVHKQGMNEMQHSAVDPNTVSQFSGLLDKNLKEIYYGDYLRIRKPYRTTQTHTGDNIPNGSYTEPMEAGIKEISGVVVFKDGCFCFDDFDKSEALPLCWEIVEWDLEMIKEAISYNNPDKFVFDDPEEGDLQYLIEEVAKVKDSQELIKYLGVEVFGGNIYENPDDLTQF